MAMSFIEPYWTETPGHQARFDSCMDGSARGKDSGEAERQGETRQSTSGRIIRKGLFRLACSTITAIADLARDYSLFRSICYSQYLIIRGDEKNETTHFSRSSRGSHGNLNSIRRVLGSLGR
jgi:hypothetical protein